MDSNQNPEMKSCRLHQLSQPDTPPMTIFKLEGTLGDDLIK